MEANKEELNKCKWKYQEFYDYYETSCGNIFDFSLGIKENKFNYCPYCGKKIKE